MKLNGIIFSLVCALNYFAFIEFSASLMYCLLVLEIFWSLQTSPLKDEGEGQWAALFAQLPSFSVTCNPRALVEGAFLPSAEACSAPSQSTCFLVLHNLS